MPGPRATWRPHCPFLIPSPHRHSIRLLKSRPSEQRRNAGTKSEHATDVGLLEGTFIRPTGPRLPSLLTHPKRRLRLEWHWAKKKYESLSLLFSYKFTIRKDKPRPKIERKKIGINAQRLHSQMYTALAEGDLPQLRTICTEGILDSFRVRIATRPKNETTRWTLHRYFDSFYSLTPRIVSTRIGRLPRDQSAIMQVVVKIKSTQSLERLKKGNTEKGGIDGQGTQDAPKTLVEYMVLQRMMLNGTEGPWKIWGTTQETKVDDVLGEEKTVGSPAVGKS